MNLICLILGHRKDERLGEIVQKTSAITQQTYSVYNCKRCGESLNYNITYRQEKKA